MSPPPAKRPRLTTTTDEGTGRAESRAISAIRPDTVFRLRRIPKNYGKKDIPGLLRTAFQQGSDFPVEVGSLARSPYRADEQDATVTLPEAKDLLLDVTTVGGNGLEWQLKANFREQERFTLHLDTHFQGFTPLHDCEEDACTADIIAVSGLNGHPFGSFKQRGGPFMWLRDGLPKDLPNTRIFIYGYDTQLQGSSSVQNLTDLGMGLRTALMDLLSRDGKHHYRSLLFIGHSLGGLVIKEAVIHMKDLSFTKILNATHGFMFFGVPNLGMSIGSLIPMVGSQPNRGLLETLGRNSALLRRHQDEFPKVFEPKVQITSFYETKLSRTACNTEDGWKMQGSEELLVDFASATVGSNDYHPIDRDHSDMVKFSGAEDSNYRATLVRIKQLDIHKGFRQCKTDNTPSISRDDSECLQSLAFASQEWHRDGVVSADGTCDWIFSHDIFNNWSQNPCQLLWIRGKPGSGKSTMMKHISQSLYDKMTDGKILATFFFNGRAEEFLTTLLALYRALLNQILSCVPEYLLELTQSYKGKKAARKEAWDWTVDELHKFFAKVIPAISAKHHIYLLVDALDESGVDNACKLIMQFEKVLVAAQKAGGVLKICFSCRHYPILTMDPGLTITMESCNQNDIKAVVRERLQHLNKEERPAFEDAILQRAQGVFQWACLVTERVFSLRRRRKPIEYILETTKETPKELGHLYSSLLLTSEPDEDPTERKQILKLFRWVCLAHRPLYLDEVQHILAIDADMTSKSKEEYMQSNYFTQNEDDIAQIINDMSRGLVEIRVENHYMYEDLLLQNVWVPPSHKTVMPIHQTVLDYLLDSGLRELQESADSDPSKSGHCYIFKTCVQYLKLVDRMDNVSSNHSSSLQGYSLFQLPYHLGRAGHHEIKPADLLDLFGSPTESSIFNNGIHVAYLGQHYPTRQLGPRLPRVDRKSIGVQEPLRPKGFESRVNWPQHDSSLLHLAALVGLPEVLGLALETTPELDVDRRDGGGNTPLDVALWAGQACFTLEIVSRFPDLIGTYFVANPWPAAHLAASGAMDAVLLMSFKYGMDPNGLTKSCDRQNYQGLTPLSEAARNGHTSTCLLLLDHGADLNLIANTCHNALSLAILSNNKDLCRLLISRGAKILQGLAIAIELQEDEKWPQGYAKTQQTWMLLLKEFINPIEDLLRTANEHYEFRVAIFLEYCARWA